MPTVLAIHAQARNHALVSEAIATLPETDLVGASRSAGEALRIFDTLAPDAVTVDVHLPDGDGIELARQLRASRPGLCVVLFGPASSHLVRRAVTAGIVSYVPGTGGVAQTASVIRVCLEGHASLSSGTRAAVLHDGPPPDLSRREREVDALICDGLTAAQIAEQLQLSESTVRTYVARVRAKIGTNRGPFPGRPTQ